MHTCILMQHTFSVFCAYFVKYQIQLPTLRLCQGIFFLDKCEEAHYKTKLCEQETINIQADYFC
jgi:hypothetical protein